MRVHTTSVPATKYLPIRIHVKLTDDFNVPNNIKDKTFMLPTHDESDHDIAAGLFLIHMGMADVNAKKIDRTLTRRGWVYQIVESA
ncbi:MAG: hypothetical protein EB127_18125 [Alphaproteobacteria bacterium]|nr:hypothetical protein [Alphaproteobacteria bacterium]